MSAMMLEMIILNFWKQKNASDGSFLTGLELWPW